MKILYVAPASPWPANFGGGMRVASILAALRRRAEVSLVVVTDEPGPEAREAIAREGGRLWAARAEGAASRTARIAMAVLRRRSIPGARFLAGERGRRLRDSLLAERADLVLLGDTFFAELLEPLLAAGRRTIVDTSNVESDLWRGVSGVAPTLVARVGFGLLASNTAALERRMLTKAPRVWAASEDDAAWYRRRLGLRDVVTVPNVLPPAEECAAAGPSPLPDGPAVPVVVSTGLYAYPPNEDAAMELLRVSRVLLDRGIEHRLCLVGRGPTARMLAAASREPQAIVTGEVERVEPWLAAATVFAAPLRAGSGTKFKILQAMSAGVPVVTTRVGARGLDLVDEVQARVRDGDAFVDALASLLLDASARTALGESGRRHVASRFSEAALDAAVAAGLDG